MIFRKIGYKLLPVVDWTFVTTANVIQSIAKLFGFPDNPGMPLILERTAERREFYYNLPRYTSNTTYNVPPSNFFEALFGVHPSLSPVNVTFYTSKTEGFYNFYITYYKNLLLLPDWLSETLQIRFNQCMDLSTLEALREAIFLAVISYAYLVYCRTTLSWFLSINPYVFPVYFITALTDWIYESMLGFMPVILGIDPTPAIVTGSLGKLADTMNCLVFTMPFLPSEGNLVIKRLRLDRDPMPLLVYRGLPELWQKYPIPDELRKYWLNERPEIIKFMQDKYGHLGINFLPSDYVGEFKYNTTIFEKLSNLFGSNSDSLHTIMNHIHIDQSKILDFLHIHVNKLI